MIRRIKKYLTKVQNTPTQLNVEKYKLMAPASHKIEDYLSWLKYYSRNLPRIATYIESKYSAFSIIDIGANIGDTVALLRSAGVEQMVYAVEGEPSYYKMLCANLRQFSKVEALQYFLGEQSQKEHFSVSAVEGTAQLSSNENQSVDVKKFDDVVAEKALENIKLLKIDTDGFDLKILRGSFDVLKRDKPILFFEYDAKYLKAQGDDGLAIFDSLAEIGYSKMLYYDNYGKFLISISTRDKRMIEQLYGYITKGEGAFYYYDICVFHNDDDDLAEMTITNEMVFFKDDDN